MSPSKTRETESGQGLKFSGVFLGLGKTKKYKIKIKLRNKNYSENNLGGK